ncbi:MAG: hypothetical protein AYL32_000060 [Candidatus Bathyarchaeota archaeon B26-2]|nr:MAG: hypothetical protein AYL32_000060 [Candidatus Bathyarchaeota archaeon B26-2]
MEGVRFFDCNSMIGRRAYREPETIYSKEQFLEDFKYYNIVGSLVYEALAVEYNPAVGNERLMTETEGSERLFPSWVLMPHQTGEMKEPKELIASMVERKVLAARLFPKRHRFSLSGDSCKPLLDELEKNGIPVFIDAAEATIGEVLEVCKRHPDLKVVRTRQWHGEERLLFPALERCDNLYIDTVYFQGFNVIAFVCKEFGADRMLYSADLPYADPGAAKMHILYADINLKEKRMIASENLQRLLGGVELKPYPDWKPADNLIATVEEGRPLSDVLVIDAHGHISGEDEMTFPGKFAPNSDAEGLIKAMDALGVDMMVISAGASLYSDSKLGNKIVAEAMRRYPNRFIGAGCINPNYPEDIDEEIQFCFYKSGMKVVKPYPAAHKYPLFGSRYRRLLECADRLRLPVLTPGYCDHLPEHREPVKMVEKLSREYPKAKFLMVHSGSRYPVARRYVELAKRCGNVFLEITYTTITYGMIKYLVDEVGDDRVLFGSDAAFRDIAPQLGWVVYAKISEESKRKILGLNMKRILDDVKAP